MTVFPAHIRQDDTGKHIQTAAEHCRHTAEYARACLSGVGLGTGGYLAGLVHDCGKFKEEFARYLEDPNGKRATVNHTFAGCRLLMERYHTEERDMLEKLTAELLALAAGSHHGLFDCIDETRRSGFLHRMTKPDIGYQESRENFLSQCVPLTELDELFDVAVREVSPICERLWAAAGEDDETYAFQTGLLARLILSAVIEGDRLDTAQFMQCRESPTRCENMAAFWRPYLERVEAKLERLPADTPLSAARREISGRCRAFAEKPGGIYRLNVPTGAGKTLSSLRYALAHAEKYKKKRLIFLSPLLSILEQNAAVIRGWLEDDTIILEHHSNVLRPEVGTELELQELAVESWDQVVILSTLVQFLNTLFDGHTTSIRRFQALCGSVIVIDEVQTVPTKLLSMFNCALDFLAEICGATVLLCSATQPCLERAQHPMRRCAGDVIPYDPTLWEPFRRTVITDAGGKTLEEIAAFAAEVMEEVQSLLVICNRKDEAEYLFSNLNGRVEETCHLSAAMCAAHRRDVLARLRTALGAGKTCLCVATQVIEAGVDISFERVIRLTAGMDSVVQAAGRCNRNGERDAPPPVYVVSCLGEDLRRLREIGMAKNASESLLYAFREKPERFGGSLASDEAIGFYYRGLYASMDRGYQDCPVRKRRTTLFDLLALNTKYNDMDLPFAGSFWFNQGFKLAGDAFRVFDNETRDLVVPYGDGAELIAELTGRSAPTPEFLARWVRRAKSYTVSVYDWQLARLGSAVTEYAGIAVLAPGFYSRDTGLRLGQAQHDFLEV